jgi:hypothetical protein
MWYNPIMVWLLNSPLHGMLSGNTMVIHYTGRKSRKGLCVPVGYLRQGEVLLTISYKHRTWWRNLRGGADVTLHLKGKDVGAHTEVIEDDQGVAEGLKVFIGGNQQAAHMFGVSLGVQGQPEPESLQKAACERVIVRTSLK